MNRKFTAFERKKVEALHPGFVVSAGPFFIHDPADAVKEKAACQSAHDAQTRRVAAVLVVAHAGAAWVLCPAQAMRTERGTSSARHRTEAAAKGHISRRRACA